MNYGKDGSSIESLSVGEPERSQQRYESMREQSIAGGAQSILDPKRDKST
jgi:hypothetical protein